MIHLRPEHLYLFVSILSILVAGCGEPQPRSEQSYNAIKKLVTDQTAGQIQILLGAPDTRKLVFESDERWTWWNYTIVEGNDYPSGHRGKVVHLEILFRNPNHQKRLPYEEWKTYGSYAVSYRVPNTNRKNVVGVCPCWNEI